MVKNVKESVVRNLTKTIAAVSLLAPASAYPLGVGDIKLHSALNQNLDAEIALLLSAGENIADIRVRLAPPEKFDEAGVPWSYFLTKIKFEAVTRADGSVFVKLSSTEAFKEPFLDFLLEVNWAKGNLYREFTVLVDPPVAYSQPIIPVVEKAEQQVEDLPQQVEDLPVVASTPEKVSADVADTVYGPTRRSDNVWKIAEQTNSYDDVSIEQMMMAIYEANPKAFYKDNVNALMAGQSLRIPEREIILKLSQKQASAAFRKQNKEWEGRVLDKEQEQQTVSDSSADNAKLELVAPVESEIGEAVVVVAEKDASVDSIVDLKTEKTDVSASEESLVLQAKYEKLEQQLLKMQQELALKDQELAALQSQKTVTTVPEIEKIQTEATKTKVDSKQDPVDTTKVKPVAKIEPKAKVKPKTKPKKKPVVQPEPESGFMPWGLGGSGVAILGLLGWLFWRKRKAEEELESESMFASASKINLPGGASEISVPVVDDNSSYDVGAVGESSFLSEFTPSDFDAFDTDQNEVDPISEADVYLAYGRYQQAEDLMRQAIEDQPERDECKLKLMEIFYANENTGSFEEYATELVDSGKHNDQEFWLKIVEMGAELIPESSLFTEQTGDKAVFEINTSEDDSVVEENLAGKADAEAVDNEEPQDESNDEVADFDLSVFDEDKTESEVETEEKTDNSDIDFDLSVFNLDEPSADQSKDVEEMESVEFDTLSEVETDEKSSEEIELKVETVVDDSVDSEQTEEQTESFDDFDFDFDSDTKASDDSGIESSFDLDIGVSDLTDMDELETKIDLAKAYIDMGDLDAAKTIAEEVLEKGNEEQKIAAQAIIDQL